MRPTLQLDANSVRRFVEEAKGRRADRQRAHRRIGVGGYDQTLGAPTLAMELLEGETLA